VGSHEIVLGLAFFRMSSLFDNISTRREVVEFRWDTQNTHTLPY